MNVRSAARDDANDRNSCPRVIGTASWSWVRPILTTCSNSMAFFLSDAMRSSSACVTATCLNTTASFAALGYASLVLWHMFTWSLGWTLE